MITTFDGATADSVWQAGFSAVANNGNLQPSRNGEVHELLHVGFTIQNPRQRWTVTRLPALNPAFAIAEVVWILCGRNDAQFLNYWNSQLPKFAGNGDIYHGAYGYRLRHHFDLDQLERAFLALRNNPESRQTVLQIWDAKSDFPDQQGLPFSEDIPCNVMAFLKIRDHRLEWMQVNRSNDVFLGVPHNFIQFTTLQEVIAGWLEVDLGSYNHLSDSFHIYEKDMNTVLIDGNIIPEHNSDSLMLSKNESDIVFAKLAEYIEILISETLDKKSLITLIEENGLNRSFQNLLTIMCAESARRRKWYELSTLIMDKCSNLLFHQLWERWISRMGHHSSLEN